MTRERADFRLGGVLVEPERLRLSSAAASVQVQPRVMDVIVALADAEGVVLSRAALQRQVWGNTQVGYHALARAVSGARKALEAVQPGVAFIETIARRGYCVHVAIEPVKPRVSNRATVPATAARMPGIVPIAGLSLLTLGLVMHAANLHGSPLHLLGAAGVLGMATWFRTSAFRIERHLS